MKIQLFCRALIFLAVILGATTTQATDRISQNNTGVGTIPVAPQNPVWRKRDVTRHDPVALFGWIKLCENQRKIRICLTHREQWISKEGSHYEVAVGLRTVEGTETAPKLIIQVPAEHLLHAGVLLIFDSGEEFHPRFVFCVLNVCHAEIDADKKRIAVLRNARSLTIRAAKVTGGISEYAVSLTGFSVALDDPPAEKADYAAKRKAVLQGRRPKSPARNSGDDFLPGSELALFWRDSREITTPVRTVPDLDQTRFKKDSSTGWVKQCQFSELYEVKACFVHYTRTNKDNGKMLVMVGLRQFDGYQDLIVSVPLGVYLPAGLDILVPKYGTIRGRYFLCQEGACYARATVDEKLIERFRVGRGLEIRASNVTLKKVSFPVPLYGFTKAFESAPAAP